MKRHFGYLRCSIIIIYIVNINYVHGTPEDDLLKQREKTAEETNVFWSDLKQEVEEITEGNPSCQYNVLENCSISENNNYYYHEHQYCYGHCDNNPSCLEYGDCCFDLASSKPPIIYPQNDLQLTCETLNNEASFPGVLMVSSCLKSYENSIYETNCLREIRWRRYNFTHDLPLVSTATNKTYINYYCAICNDDAEHLLKVNLFIDCYDISTEQIKRLWSFRSYSTESSLANLHDEDKDFLEFLDIARYVDRASWIYKKRLFKFNFEMHCRYHVEEYRNQTKFTSRYNLRNCFHTSDVSSHYQIDKCSKSWKDSTDFKKCSAYTWRILDRTTETVYKNPHCAVCNNVNISAENFSCKRFLKKSDVSNRGSTLFPFQILFQPIILQNASTGESKIYFENFNTINTYTTLVVLIISLICLALHISIYCFVTKRKTWHGRNLLCFCIALFMAQFLFLLSSQTTSQYELCFVFSLLVHYFWLSSFFWMNILSIDTWRTFRSKVSISSINSRKIFVIYSLYAWVVPLAIVVAALIIDMTGILAQIRPAYANRGLDGPPKLCWITNVLGLVVFFLNPIGLIIIGNCILFALTTHKIIQQTEEFKCTMKNAQSLRAQESKNNAQENTIHTNRKVRFIMYVKLGLLQGLTWISGFIACFAESPEFWLIFTLINGLQGTVIFCIFDMSNERLVILWKNTFAKDTGIQSLMTTTTSLGLNDIKTSENQTHLDSIEAEAEVTRISDNNCSEEIEKDLSKIKSEQSPREPEYCDSDSLPKHFEKTEKT